MSRFGWRPFFIFLGLISLLWLLPWFRWRPREHPISQGKSQQPFAGIREVLQQRSAWGTCLGVFSGNYVLYLLVTWLPFYLVHERHFSLVSTGKIGGAAFLLKATSSITSGRLSDLWISSGATPTLVRKALLGVGLTSSGILLVLAALTPTNLSLIFLFAASASLGLATPHYWAVSQTLAGPKLAGTWTSWQLFIGNFGSILAPVVTGFFVDRTGNFLWAFVTAAVVAWFGAMSWVFLVGPIRQLVWGEALQSKPLLAKA